MKRVENEPSRDIFGNETVKTQTGFICRIEGFPFAMSLDAFFGNEQPQLLEEVGKFRYKLYVEKLGYMHPDYLPDGLELDDWDKGLDGRKAIHILLRQGADCVGYTRLLWSPSEASFLSASPQESLYDTEHFLNSPPDFWSDTSVADIGREHCFEVSRLMLDPDKKKEARSAILFLFEGMYNVFNQLKQNREIQFPDYMIGNMKYGLLQYIQFMTQGAFESKALESDDINYVELANKGEDWVQYFKKGSTDQDEKQRIHIFWVSVNKMIEVWEKNKEAI